MLCFFSLRWALCLSPGLTGIPRGSPLLAAETAKTTTTEESRKGGVRWVCFPGRSELRRRVGLDRVDAVITGLGGGVGLDEV